MEQIQHEHASVLIGVFAMFQLLDAITTNIIIRQGGYEKNPVMRWFMKVFGRLWWWPKLALVIGVVLAHVEYQYFVYPAAFAVLMLLVLLYMWIVYNNAGHIKK